MQFSKQALTFRGNILSPSENNYVLLPLKWSDYSSTCHVVSLVSGWESAKWARLKLTARNYPSTDVKCSIHHWPVSDISIVRSGFTRQYGKWPHILFLIIFHISPKEWERKGNSVPGAVVPTCSLTANLQINEQKGIINHNNLRISWNLLSYMFRLTYKRGVIGVSVDVWG